MAVLKHPRPRQEFIRFMRLFREKQLARVKMVFTKQADPQMDPAVIPAAQATDGKDSWTKKDVGKAINVQHGMIHQHQHTSMEYDII